jgi:hypothetical protein
MWKRRAGLGISMVVAAVSLAACSKSTPTNAASSPPSIAATESQTPAPGVNAGGSFCTTLKAEKAKEQQLGKEFASTATTPDLATIKQNFDRLFAAEAQSMARVEAAMTSAPANVQAAVQVVNQYVSQLKSTIDNATSLQQLGASLSQLSSTKQFAAAGKVLAAYTTSQCGSSPSP